MVLGKKILVTGGAGFIGSAFIRYGLKHIPFCEKIVNLDLLTYAGDVSSLEEAKEDPRYFFIKGDIRDEELTFNICKEHGIEAIVHFAAETHVDRSISGPRAFFETNVAGTFSLLEMLRKCPHVHLHHISTDEVFGSLQESELPFSETHPYHPNSPYAASKAAADHFVRAYAHTYGLFTTISHTSNNYGPFQHSEKFIPCLIEGCLKNKKLPLYGKGLNIRDWLYVEDHAEALWLILEKGKRGQVYNIGGECEMKNSDLLYLLIHELASLTNEDPKKYEALITYVTDRPGHDFRYGIDCRKIKKELNWKARHSLKAGLRKTIEWFIQKELKEEVML